MKRLDREGVYTIPVWIGLFLTGLWVVWVPQADPLLSDSLENELAVAVTLGSGMCLVGAMIHDRITAYKLEIVGLVMTFIVLGFVAAHVDRSILQQFTLAGGLGAIVQIGNVRMIVQLAASVWHDYKSRR